MDPCIVPCARDTPPAVRVLYFAAARVAAGCAAEQVMARPGLTAGQLLEEAAERHPRLRPLLPALRLAVNHEFAHAGQPIEPGDEVALLPPVQGG